jgi:hypothetical protein
LQLLPATIHPLTISLPASTANQINPYCPAAAACQVSNERLVTVSPAPAMCFNVNPSQHNYNSHYNCTLRLPGSVTRLPKTKGCRNASCSSVWAPRQNEAGFVVPRHRRRESQSGTAEKEVGDKRETIDAVSRTFESSTGASYNLVCTAFPGMPATGPAN